MRTVTCVLLLVVFSVASSFSVLGQDTTLPFEHTSCNGADLSGQTIAFYHVIDQSEQIDTLVEPLKAGYADASAYFNIHGGICGAAVENIFSDPGEQNIMSQYDDFVALVPRPVMVALYSSPSAEDLRDQLSEDEIPALLVRGGTNAALYGDDGKSPGWIFGTNPLYVNQIGATCDYIADHPESYPTSVIGFLSWDESWTRAAITDEVIAYCASQGVGFAGAAYFDASATNIQVYAQDLIDAGANIIYTLSLEDSPALIAHTIMEIGLEDQVRLAGFNLAMDPAVALFGTDRLGSDGLPILNGMIGSLPARSWTEIGHPSIQFITEQADLNQRPTELRNRAYISAWSATDLFIEAYIQTGNRIEFDTITGADIKETLENIVYETLGGIQLIDYQAGARRDLPPNRIGEIAYLGENGVTPAGPDNSLLTVGEANEQTVIPMLIPLTGSQPAPDLRPGGTDALTVSAAPSVAIAPTSTTSASLDTNLIAFQTDRDGNSEIYLMNADGSSPTNLTNNQAFDAFPAWSADGAKLLFTSDRSEKSQLYSINTDGTDLTQISDNSANDMFGVWSPDGSQIAFTSDSDGSNDIYVMNADGSDRARLTSLPGAEEFPVWTRDGAMIMFTYTAGRINGEIYAMNADGTDQTNLTNSPLDDLIPSVSPDGNRIAFTAGSGGDYGYEIYEMNIDGTDVAQLTDTEDPVVSNYGLNWSPDGTHVVFVSSRDGNLEVMVMNSDGSSPINLTNDPHAEEFPAWQPNTSTKD